MLTRLRGLLESVDAARAVVSSGDLSYECLLSGHDSARLRPLVGDPIELHVLHYLESQSNGAILRPRLIAFASPEDRTFFELFTTVKGIGYRKALRALQLPLATIAAAIAARDVDTLRTLPEIGKRTAETIVLELHDKVGDVHLDHASPEPDSVRGASKEAVQVLVQLGEGRLRALELVERVGRADPSIESPDELVSAALRLKDL